MHANTAEKCPEACSFWVTHVNPSWKENEVSQCLLVPFVWENTACVSELSIFFFSVMLSWGSCACFPLVAKQLAFCLSVHCIFLLTWISPFPMQLFYKNGQPFPAHRPLGLRVHICHVELAIDIPVTQEVLQEPNSNVVKVAFTVRRAGRYEISIKLGGLNVAYSPYYKVFQPGKV